MNVSVVIPTFNHGRYLARALNSALGQTTEPDEVIVIDDGSTDETAEVMRGFPSVKYLHQANRGLSAARNRGIAESRGQWIAFLDADDWWDPKKIMLQLRAAATYPAASLIYTSSYAVTPKGDRRLNRALRPAETWPRLRYQNCISGGSGAMVKRAALIDEGGFDEALTACEDWDLWVRLARKYQFAAVPEPVTIILDSSGSMSTQYERMLRNTETVLRKTLVSDITGLRRVIWERRIRSAALFSASISARDSDSGAALGLLLRSVSQWPSPFFIPKRWAALGISFIRRWCSKETTPTNPRLDDLP